MDFNFAVALLADENNMAGNILSYVFLGVLVVAFIVMMIFSSRKNKKKQEEQEATIKAIRPGNKVKTIGGICGIVVEVNSEENTFVLESGNELNGKSYLKFDMQAIYQTDAKPEPVGKVKEKAEEKTEETAEGTYYSSEEKSEETSDKE